MELQDALAALLRTDAADAGCERTWRLIDVYVELVVAGADPEQHLPGITSHLSQCGPCLQDYEGLLAAVRGVGASTGAGVDTHRRDA